MENHEFENGENVKKISTLLAFSNQRNLTAIHEYDASPDQKFSAAKVLIIETLMKEFILAIMEKRVIVSLDELKPIAQFRSIGL